MPCDRCKRTQQTCIAPTQPATSSFVFVNPRTKPEMRLLSQVSFDKTEREVKYFFSSFLPMNTFSHGNLLVQRELQSIMHSSNALRDALCAIASLHRFQQIRCSGSGVEDRNWHRSAMQLYVGSVRCVQAQITQNKFADDPSTLWTTFLLGLFEVCEKCSSRRDHSLT